MDEKVKRRIPAVGMRNLKTAAAATLCGLAYLLIGRNPTFACIGAIFGMGGSMHDSKLHGGNRLFGTILGGLLGIALFAVYLQLYPAGGHHFMLLPLLFVGVVVLILLSQLFWVGAVQPGGVVLCIILFNTPAASYISYSVNRIVDTAVGVLVALSINALLPRHRLEGWLSRLGFASKHEDATDNAGDDYAENA